MTNEKFPKPRALRNEAKQSILILGQPGFLYKEKEIKETFILFDGKRKSLGCISDDIHIKLEDMSKATDTKIIRITKKKIYPVSSIEGFTSISVQKHKKDTMLVVPATNEATLMEKVNKLKELLESKGAITQERCNWMCIADKGKVNVSNEEILQKEKIAKVIPPIIVQSTDAYGHVTSEEIKRIDPTPNNTRIVEESGIKIGIKDTIPKIPEKKEMPEHTKALQKMALEMIKKSEEKS